MLDVILYGHDRFGYLDLRERQFRSIGGLARFFSSGQSHRWEWAEVTRRTLDGRSRVVRYSAEQLRSITVSPVPSPSLN